jgi:hypothetical protein
LLTGSTTVTVSENFFNNYNEGTFIFDQNGLPVPYYGTTYANTLNAGLVQNAVVNNAGLVTVGGNNTPIYGVPSGDTYSMKLSFTTGTKQFCEPCALELIYGNDGIVYVKGNPNTPLDDQKCCQNYWLPNGSSNPTVVCPKPTELAITSPSNPLGPCIIIESSTGKPVTQSCCNKNTLGFDVAWDGKNCVDPRCSGGIGGGGIDVGVGSSTQRGFTFSGADLFAGQPAPGGVSPFICYWCPPDSSIQIVCTVGDYLALLTQTEIEQLALSYGWDNTTVDSDPSAFLITILTPFFTTYGCLYLDNIHKPISSSACCTLKGGTWTLIDGKYYCVSPASNPCANTVSNANHVYVNISDNSLVLQPCCTTLGYTWTDGSISMVGEPNFNDTLGLSYANSLNEKNYCTACPTQLVTVNDCDNFGVCTLIIKDNLTNTNLSQQCCTDYGFTYEVTTGRCLKCPTTVNYEATHPYTITQLDGSSLSQTCCENINAGASFTFPGWYGNAFGDGNKCYQCPGINIFDDLGVMTPNTNYTVMSGEVLYGGSSLSQTCCDNYNVSVGGVAWDPISQKCLAG